MRQHISTGMNYIINTYFNQCFHGSMQLKLFLNKYLNVAVIIT